MAAERTPVAALGEMVEAVNAADAARYARVYAEDATIVIQGGETLRGRPAIEAYEVSLLQQFPGTRIALFAVWQGEPWVVAHYGVRSPGPPGKESGHEGLLFYRFDERGAIVEERRYLDSLTPMSQVGLLGPERAPLPELPAQPALHAGAVRRELPALPGMPGTWTAGAKVREVMYGWPPGQDAAAWEETWRARFAGTTVEPVNVVGVGDYVLAEVLLRGRLAGPLGPLQPSATAFTVHRALVVELSGGRVARVTAFMNGRELAQALGQWPPPALRPASPATGRR